jgi:hypothetical protein
MNETTTPHSLTYEQLADWWAELIGCSIALEGIADTAEHLIETQLNPGESIQQMILSVQRRMDAVVEKMDHPINSKGFVPMVAETANEIAGGEA